MRRIAVVHFSPLELYPPVQNMLRSLNAERGITCCVYTTKNTVIQLSAFQLSNHNIQIKRFGTSGNDLSAFERWSSYCKFYIGSFLHMMVNRPVKILYYETLSFYPVYLYKKFIDKGVGLWAHYHEYTSPKEYKEGMKLSKEFHQFERSTYAHMDGVSHTNDQRLKLFLADIAPAKPRSVTVIPNFPPRAWVPVGNLLKRQEIRIIYIGALSMDTMYTKEFATWVELQRGKVTWDIYTSNITAKARLFIEGCSRYIRLHAAVDYDKLPEILSRYDIGVILYTGHIPNYVYNAPNKLFEYLRMGLQVWLPDSLKGALPFLEADKHPRVLAINFNELTLRADDIVIERGVPINQYIAEDANKPLLNYLMQ